MKRNRSEVTGMGGKGTIGDMDEREEKRKNWDEGLR